MMILMEALFGKRKAPEKLASQAVALDELYQKMKAASDDLEEIKEKLVEKANGALYPGEKLK